MKKTHRISWRDLLRQVRILPLVVFLTSQPLFAEVPTLINYQGRLTDAQGNPVTGNRTMEVRIYDAPTGGNMTYIETINKETTGTVSVTNGTYSFSFGAFGNGIGAALTGQDYLALTVNGSEEQTRTRLLAVPYALSSEESSTSLDAQGILNGTLALPEDSIGSNQLSSNAILSRHLAPGVSSSHQVVSGNFQAEVNKSYYVNSISEQCIVNLPENPQVGDIVRVVSEGALVRAPQNAFIIHDWSWRKIETSTENAASVNQMFCSDNAEIIYVSIQATEKDQSITSGRPTIAVSLDFSKSWVFLDNLVGNNTANAVDLHGCTANGSRALISVDTQVMLLENYGNSTINIPTPEGISRFESLRLSIDGNRIFGWSMVQGIWVTDDLGFNWRKSPNFASGEEIQVFNSGPANNAPFEISASGSEIVLPAIKISDSSHVFVFSDDAGLSWRILEIPFTDPHNFTRKISLSRDGTRIFVFPSLYYINAESVRLMSDDKGISWNVEGIEFFPDPVHSLLPAAGIFQIFQSQSSNLFYAGSLKSINHGKTWTNLPEIYIGSGSKFNPVVTAISSTGIKTIATAPNFPETSGKILISWRQEMSCPSALEFFYTGDGNWRVVSK